MSSSSYHPDFIAVVPARAASTRLPGKMLADIAGTPMVVHTARRAAASQAKAVYIATDDKEIFDVVTAHGFQALMTDTAHPSGTDRLAEVVQQLALSPDTLLVNVQGDEPLIDPALINQVAATLASNPDASIATAAYPIHDLEKLFNPNVVKVVLTQSAEALYFSRAPIPWARDSFKVEPKALPDRMQAYHHIGLYAYRAHFLSVFPKLSPGALEQLESLEQLRALENGYKIQVMITDSAPAPGVDSAEDLEIVRKFF
ncbi:3-deoxy-manno-octulosonate cytidylyltransferase [Oligella sp. MSHR50489EDL]|uniref:3-deoxy-manno-octulosonate cytidylyltransferase n=1 Tax=Oligella sp. MSHR50489EDL TaxID=3139409 RepID=UPI003D815EDA